MTRIIPRKTPPVTLLIAGFGAELAEAQRDQGTGFKSYESASRFCRCFGELRNHLYARSHRSRNLSTSARRDRFLTRGIIALRILEAA
jgi:hypothetical protein